MGVRNVSRRWLWADGALSEVAGGLDDGVETAQLEDVRPPPTEPQPDDGAKEGG